MRGQLPFTLSGTLLNDKITGKTNSSKFVFYKEKEKKGYSNYITVTIN